VEINFIVSHMTELSLTNVFVFNTGGRTEDNAVIHEKTHGVLFASNEYCKFIFLRDFPANGTKFINKGHQTCVTHLSN